MFEQTVLSEAEKPMNLLFLERPRVDRILEKALQSYMVTVVAGEGSGKTHAVNSFLRKHKRNVTWIQISEQDNLGWHLWENYLGEVARVGPETAKLFSDIGFPESDQQLDQYLGLLKDKTMGLADPYVTVFDDFHLITNPEVLLHLDRALAALVSNNPFVFISRTEPTIRTVNFLSKGILSEITVDDLRFTREETESYFRLNNIFIEEKALSRIFEKTEGWPLALGLILQEIKAGEAGGHNWNRVMRPIRNMEEDIFASMGAKLRCFLVKLSLMEHWPRNLLERLDPEGKNIAAMEKLSSVIRFDAYIQGFRIHSHFLDFLREQQSSLSPEEIREVCGQDARWCVENNLPTNAAIDYEWAGDYGGLIRLIESLPRTLSRTVASFFLGIVERLTGETAEDGEDRDFLFLRFIVRSRLLASLDRFEEAAAECRAVIDRFEPLAPEPGRSLILAAAYNNLGTLSIRFCRYTRSYDFAEWFEKGYRHYLENPEPARGQIGQSNIGSYAIQVGIAATPEELKVFVDACAAAAAYTSVSLSGYLCGTDALTRSELAYYQGDMNRAEQFARRAAYQGREKNQYEVETCALFYLMRLNIARGNIAGIREAEQQLKLQMEKGEYINRYNIQDTIMGRFYIRLGMVEKIAPWLRMERGEGELNVLSRGFDTLIRARCLFIEKNFPAALQILKDEEASGDLGSFLLGFLEMTVLEAMILHQLGDREGALGALKKACDAALPHGLVMPFVELGGYMHSLVSAVLKTPPGNPADATASTSADAEISGIPRQWLQTIRRDASAYAKKRSLVAAQYENRETPLPPDFSQYELSILNGLSQGRTSEEISDAIHTPVKMVKSAIRQLYIKLGAANRADAVRNAIELGLLTDTGTADEESSR